MATTVTGSDVLYRRIEAARIRAELTVQDMWLRYVACGGTNDVLDVDGFLQGLIRMSPFEQMVLGHTVNEALQDQYAAYRIPLPGPTAEDASAQDRLREVILLLNDTHSPPPPAGNPGKLANPDWQHRR